MKIDWAALGSVFGVSLVVTVALVALFTLGITGLSRRERAVVAFYGVRGIGTIYYLGYAATHVEFVDKGALWAIAAFTIFASTVIHGLTAAETVRVLVRE